MKNIYKYVFGLILAFCATSCGTTTPVVATENPVGNKCGVARTRVFLTIFGGSSDCGINKAAKNGGITRISHVDRFSVKSLGLLSVYGVRVYGE